MSGTSRSVVAIVPTHNEPDDLRRVVASLVQQGLDGLHILVVNAGERLPPDLQALVEEIQVGSDHYWSHCIDVGLKLACERGYSFVYLTNADTYATPQTIKQLLEHVEKHERTVACAPAYVETEKGVKLLYSHQDPLGPLIYGKLVRPWEDPSVFPKTPFEVVLTGGQGVLFPLQLAREFSIDVARFPHYASDHDLWLQARKGGWKLEVVPSAGVVNTRTLSASHAKGLRAKLAKLWWRMTSDKTPESWRIMWRLRRKHLPLPVAVFSTVVSFGLRWTVGLPKILRRT